MFSSLKYWTQWALTKRFTTERFAEEFAEKMLESSATGLDMRSYGMFFNPFFFEGNTLFLRHPRMDFVALDRALKRTRYTGYVGWSLLHLMLSIHDGNDIPPGQEKLLKLTILRIAIKHPEVFFDGILQGQAEATKNYRGYLWSIYVEFFSRMDDAYAVLRHPASRNPENEVVVQMSVALLKKHDPNYEYADYPGEWLEDVYGHQITHTCPPIPTLWGEKVEHHEIH